MRGGIAVALGMVACAEGPRVSEDRCEVAEQAVVACNGEAADGFYEACIDAGPEDDELIDALVAASCPQHDELADARVELIRYGFAGACSAAVLSAELVTRQRNRDTIAYRLPASQRDQLDDYFGELADQVRVHFHAELVDRWVILGQSFELSNVYAQTFGNHIYVDDAFKSGDLAQRAVMAHEIQHAQQARDAGSLESFAFSYCLAFWDSGFQYRTNAMEEEAREVQASFLECIRDGVGCHN